MIVQLNLFAHLNLLYALMQPVFKAQLVVTTINMKIVQILNHLDAMINLVLVLHLNVLPEFLVVNLIKCYVQITLVLIISYNVKFQTNVNLVYYVLTNHVDQASLCVQNKSVANLDILSVCLETVRNPV
jgi:hypothetical protein